MATSKKITQNLGSSNGLGLIERPKQRFEFGLQLTLAFLNHFELELVAVELDRCVMDVALHFGRLRLALEQGPLQFALPVL